VQVAGWRFSRRIALPIESQWRHRGAGEHWITEPPAPSLNDEFPTVLPAPFPQPVALQSYVWIRNGTVDNCEVSVSIVGTRLD
jgi:hypothetical protein